MAGRRSTLDLLRRYESRHVTYLAEDGSWPIVWERAKGMQVWDEPGRKYLDLTAAFGVAAAGHANPAVVRAAARQAGTLLHAMGDVHPHRRKAELARELSALTFERWIGRPGKVIFGSSGFEAVEAAMKTAVLATGRAGIVAFEGGYHGLGYGALNPTHRPYFKEPFRGQLGGFAEFVPFPAGEADLPRVEKRLVRILSRRRCGGVLVEPMQARGGIRIPPEGFLKLLRRVCDAYGVLLILDEIYTGFGRTGRWFACEHEGIAPDVICLGKALTGGFPLSACVGRADLMDAAWPVSPGEAIHTSTFLGHPVGCAMALAQLAEIRRLGLIERSARMGGVLLEGLNEIAESYRGPLRLAARGRGLMAGLELTTAGGEPATGDVLRIVTAMLHRGFILLPEGEHAEVIGFTPPLTISRAQIERTLAALGKEIARQ